MDAKTVMESDEFKKCVAFHGHLCPGLCIGYRAAAEGLAHVRAQRSEDEEVVAVVENDACGVDAVQWLTGCTFGKGNLIFKDYGKQVFVFYSRAGGAGVRLSLRADAFASTESRDDKIRLLLEAPAEQLFDIREVDRPAPPPARIHESVACGVCGEPTMKTRIRSVDGRDVCLECLEEQHRNEHE